MIISTITNLKVHCTVDRYRRNRPDHPQSKKCHHTLRERAYTHQKKLKKKFDVLLKIKNKQKLNVYIVLRQHNIRIEVLKEVLGSLAEARKHYV
jgi:hypothetical protein